MTVTARVLLATLVALLSAPQFGCNLVPQQTLRQSQARTWQLAGQNRQLSHNNASLRSNLNVASQRLTNLQNERTLLHQRYSNLLTQHSPLSRTATKRLEELKKKYPRFDFDPQTGVSRFGDEILFNTGSAELNTGSSLALLKEFSRIMNDPGATELNILVVGHTDDRPIAKVNTRSQHPTNWHLSTNRANAVVMALTKNGINESRLGAAGYGANQPLEPNSNSTARQKNRRVEIFVLSPDAVVALWEPGNSKK